MLWGNRKIPLVKKSYEEFLEVLEMSDLINSGVSRTGLSIDHKTVMKIPAFSINYVTEVRHALGRNQNFVSRTLEEWAVPLIDDFDIYSKIIKDEIEFKVPNNYEFRYFVEQTFPELAIALDPTIKSSILMPIIEAWRLPNNFIISLWPKLDYSVCDLEALAEEEDQSEEFYNLGAFDWACWHFGIDKYEIEYEQQRLNDLGIYIDDGFDNSGNWGMWNEQIVIIDYGLSSSI